jgi:hypothetical protein
LGIEDFKYEMPKQVQSKTSYAAAAQIIVNAADFKAQSDTVLVMIGDRRIRCSKYLLRQRSKYFEEILSVSDSENADIVIVERNPQKAVAFIQLLHQLQPIEPEWDFEMAELASKWSVEEYVTGFRVYCKKCIDEAVNIASPRKSVYDIYDQVKPRQCVVDAKQFWEMVSLVRNSSSVYYIPSVLHSKADVVKMLKTHPRFVEPAQMSCTFTEDEISIIMVAL